MTCGEALVRLLAAYGVDTVFGIPGVHTVELYRGLAHSGVRHITPRHEQGAGFMADGYARASGRPGVCFVITGPGLTNIATAMGQALADSIPLLVISAVNRSAHLGRGQGRLHELPEQRALAAGLTRFSHTLLQPQALPEVLAQAFAVFASQRPGPVHIEIPVDVIAAPADVVDLEARALPSPPAPDPAALGAAAEWLRAAERPLLVLGGGAVGAADAVTELAERLDAPAMNTVNAKGVLPYGHPLATGGSGSSPVLRDALLQADVVLALGTEFGETDFDFHYAGDVALGGKLVRIDIDARQLARNVSADLPMLGDAKLAALALNQALSHHRGERDGAARAAALREKLKAERDPHYAAFFAAISEALPDAIIVGDSTQPTYYAWSHYETAAPRRYFHSASGYGTLGYAIPAAIGAQLVCPDAPVVALIGDGGAQFSIGELASAVEAQVPVIFLLWNNYGYSEIARFMRESGVAEIGVALHTPDFVTVARGFGCQAQRVAATAELGAALVAARTRRGPTLIEVLESDMIET